MPITFSNTNGTGNLALVNTNNSGRFAASITAPTSSFVTSGLVFNLLTAPSSGTTWTDATGNGYNATLQGSPSYTGSYNGGIKLNNTGPNSAGVDFISVPYNIASSTVTVEIVASFNPTGYWATVWGNEVYSGGRGYFAFMGSSTGINYGRPGLPANEAVTPSNSVRQWIFVINGTQHSLYLNGTQVGTTDTITAQTLFATNNFYFGSRHQNDGTAGPRDVMNNSTSSLQPVFYQMRLYNKALSGAEITQNYNAVKSTYNL